MLVPYETLFDDWRAMAARARDRGELAEGLDVDATLLTLASPLVVVPLLFRRPGRGPRARPRHLPRPPRHVTLSRFARVIDGAVA